MLTEQKLTEKGENLTQNIIEIASQATVDLTDVMQNLYNAKGDRRDSVARYLSVVLTDLEKVQAYIAFYLIEAQLGK